MVRSIARRMGLPAAAFALAVGFAAAPAAVRADEASNSKAAAALGDVMGQTQLRHFKLWFAGALGNWPLAAYEVAQIRRSFESAASVGGTIGGEPLAKLLQEKSTPPLDELQTAIEAKNFGNFAKAFDKLTADCNSCHVAAHVGFIKMQVPTASPFSDQSFPP